MTLSPLTYAVGTGVLDFGERSVIAGRGRFTHLRRSEFRAVDEYIHRLAVSGNGGQVGWQTLGDVREYLDLSARSIERAASCREYLRLRKMS